MTIRVNGRERTIEARTLVELLGALGHERDPAGIAVAVNGEVVPRMAWSRTELRSGDEVEIVGAVQGG